MYRRNGMSSSGKSCMFHARGGDGTVLPLTIHPRPLEPTESEDIVFHGKIPIRIRSTSRPENVCTFLFSSPREVCCPEAKTH